MFSGMTNHSIDAKGRIVLPAKFREQLGETYYLARGFGNKCIQVMSSEQFNAMCEKILALPANLSMAVQYTFNATAVEVTPNAQGRVIIPQSLREFAEIEGDGKERQAGYPDGCLYRRRREGLGVLHTYRACIRRTLE